MTLNYHEAISFFDAAKQQFYDLVLILCTSSSNIVAKETNMMNQSVLKPNQMITSNKQETIRYCETKKHCGIKIRVISNQELKLYLQNVSASTGRC